MKSLFKLSVISATATAALLQAGAAHAAAFDLQEQSVKGLGRAFSGEVADTGAESLWWNPAAIAGQPGGVYLGASGILPRGHIDDTGTLIVRPGQAPAGVGGDPTARNPINNGVLPSGAINMPLTDRIAIGLAVTSPFSFTTNYAADSWTRYSADKTKLQTIDIQPSVAVMPFDWLRVGAGVNVEHSKATLSNALPNLSALLPDGEQTLKGSGWDVGWSAGAQMVSDRLTVGLSYKSSIKHTLDGSVTVEGLLGPLAGSNFSSSAKATFRTPWQLTLGARYRATDKLTLDLQGARFGWNKFDAIRLGAPINTAVPENYRNSWNIGGGFDYELTPALTVRAGVQFDKTPTQDGNRDARVPDGDRMNYAVGGSYKLNGRFTVDAGAMYTDFKNASIDRTTAAYVGTPAQTVILTSGELTKTHAIVLGLGGRYSF